MPLTVAFGTNVGNKTLKTPFEPEYGSFRHKALFLF
jgi:hypothetical protein